MRTASFRLSIVLSLTFAASLGFAGCKKDGDTTPPDGTSGDTGAAGTGGSADDGGDDAAGDKTWATMDRDARLTYMGTTVLPTMKEAFKQRGFDTFKCANCHGEDYQAVDFKMPNDL